MIPVLMTNQLPETGPYERPDKFHVLQAEQDVKLAVDSGYEPDAFGSLGNIVITADLQHFINEQKLKVALKESEQEQTIKLREEREEKREQSAQAAIDELSDAEKHEQYLNGTHTLGDIELTGKQWAHVSKFAEENKKRIRAEWLEEGITDQQADEMFRVMEIMSRGPQNDEERKLVKDAAKNDLYMDKIHDTAHESGIEVERKQGQEASLNTQLKFDTPAPQAF